MGWSVIARPHDLAAWLEESLTWETATRINRCRDVALTARANRAYAAVEVVDKTTGDRRVEAALVALRHRPNDAQGATLAVKDMSESANPRDMTDCPARILDQLTAPEDAGADAWRTACRDRLARRAASRGLAAGTLVRFRDPLPIGGVDHTLFAFLKGSTFHVVREADQSPRELVRIPGWRERDDRTVEGRIALPRSPDAVRLTPRRLKIRYVEGDV